VALHLEHRGHAGGDSYSSLLDHLQPFAAAALVPAAIVAVVSAFLPLDPSSRLVAPLLVALLVLVLLVAQLPMALAMTRRAGPAMLAFIPLGAIRALWRAAGLAMGVVDRTLGRGAIAREGLARRRGAGASGGAR
jgi:hypothetical protein